MSRLVRFRFGHPIKPFRGSKSALITAALLTLLVFMPMRALAQGSPFDTGFNAIQSLFTGTIAKVASLVAIVIGGYELDLISGLIRAECGDCRRSSSSSAQCDPSNN